MREGQRAPLVSPGRSRPTASATAETAKPVRHHASHVRSAASHVRRVTSSRSPLGTSASRVLSGPGFMAALRRVVRDLARHTARLLAGVLLVPELDEPAAQMTVHELGSD